MAVFDPDKFAALLRQKGQKAGMICGQDGRPLLMCMLPEAVERDDRFQSPRLLIPTSRWQPPSRQDNQRRKGARRKLEHSYGREAKASYRERQKRRARLPVT